MVNSDKEFKEIIIKRLETMPENIVVSIGSFGVFSKKDLINNVIKETQIGKMVIKMQTAYLRSMKDGFLTHA